MPRIIQEPTIVNAAGTPPKTIREYIGRVNSGTDTLSIAHMTSPSGWQEPGQCPEFDEYTLVLSGELHINTQDGKTHIVKSGQAVITKAGEWVQYHTPSPSGADYIAVCLPAFSPETVHRD
jgi:quercetin dioxygenase-like cupin family protein